MSSSQHVATTKHDQVIALTFMDSEVQSSNMAEDVRLELHTILGRARLRQTVEDMGVLLDCSRVKFWCAEMISMFSDFADRLCEEQFAFFVCGMEAELVAIFLDDQGHRGQQQWKHASDPTEKVHGVLVEWMQLRKKL